MSALYRPPGIPFGMRFHIGDATGESYTYDEIVTAARHVAWHYSLGNPDRFYPPGDMLQHYLRALANADNYHFDRLARAFPVYAALVRVVKDDDVMGLAMIMNLLEFKVTNETMTFKPDDMTDSEEAPLPVPPLGDGLVPMPPLCAHDVTEYGGCKSADCPNAAENLFPEKL